MSTQIPEVSLADNLRINLFHVLPYYLRGIFRRSPALYSLLTRLRWHPFSARFGNDLRQKYGCDYVYVRMLRRRTLFVFDNQGVQHVLDHSPAVYAESDLKRTGMSHFQPHAVTVSRGESWRQRRQFNTNVLQSDSTLHTLADDFLAAVGEAAAQPHTDWKMFERSFEGIMLRVVFGADNEVARRQSQIQKKLMHQSNRLFALRKSDLFDGFHGALKGLIHTVPGGLASLCPHADQSVIIKPSDQVSHWMFALRDTVATNTARTLALIVAHPRPAATVQQELSAADVTTAEGIDGLRYLEGCIQEAMRLWPSTPLLVRETTQKDVLGKWIVAPKTQVVIPNNHHHRDTSTYADADQFRPDRWQDSKVNYKFNHLSNGTQFCAGKNLALFLAKAFIATSLAKHRYRLRRPAIDSESSIPYMYNHYRLRFDCDAV